MLLEMQAADAKLSMAEEILRRGGVVRMRVLGESMLPSIWPGDIVSVVRRESALISKGDIGLFRRDRRLFVHRVQEISSLNDGLCFLSRGDSALRGDPPFHTSELIGRVELIQRKNGRTFPHPASSLYAQVVGWILCRCDRLRNLALRLEARRTAASGATCDRPVAEPWGSAALE